ncbi:MAG: uroporphyrinogen-III synthase [Alphaproteobacteria bacterium]
MRALITRPRENAGVIARALSERDIEPIQEPLLEIRATEHGPIDLDGIQAILLTSAFGARELAATIERRDVPIFAVGDATAQIARDAGFERVESARGDAEALALLVMEKAKPQDGALLHAGGRTVAGDLAGQLGEAGYEVRRVELYSALPAPALSIEAVEALKGGDLDIVLFFSPRTAATFVRLVQEAGIADRCASATALCLSAQVAEAARAVGWRRVDVADRPEQAAMIALVDRWLEQRDEGEGAGGDEPQPSVQPAARPEAARRPEIRWAPATPPEPASAPEPPPAPARRRGAIGLLAAALVLLFLAGAAMGYVLWQRQDELRAAVEQGQQRSRMPSAELSDLQGRIGAVENRMAENLARIERALGERIDQLAVKTEEAGQDPDLSEVDARIDELQSRLGAEQQARDELQAKIEAVEASTGQLGDRLTSGLAQIEERVSAATAAAEEAAREAARDRTAGMLLALNEVRSALAAGRPFDGPVRDLRRLGEEEPEIAASLEGWADRAEAGIPSEAELTARFKRLASDVGGRVRPQTGERWLDSVLERAGSVVRVRRVGEGAEGDSPEAVLARAEAAIDRGDLAAAVVQVETLEGEPAAAFADWLGDARARLAVADGLDRLERAATAARGAG